MTSQKRISLFTLQGLGNAFLALPIVKSLMETHQTTLYLMHEGAGSFYRNLNLGIEIQIFKNSRDLFTKKIQPSHVAASLYPNWKRELFVLMRCPSPVKYSFLDPNFRMSAVVSSHKIQREEIHDIENNFKLLDELDIHADYPSLSQLFPRSKGRKVCLHPTASTPVKYYPKHFWLEIISYFQDNKDEIHLFGRHAHAEKSFLEDLLSSLKNKQDIHLHLDMPIIDIAKEISSSRVFIGSDSGLMHLAGLLDIFTIGLWSFANYRRIYPYGNASHVYLPQEILTTTNFSYPRKELPWLNRAKASDMIEILASQKKESFVIQPLYKDPVKFYMY